MRFVSCGSRFADKKREKNIQYLRGEGYFANYWKIWEKSVDKVRKDWYSKQAVWNTAAEPVSRAKKLREKRKKCLTNLESSGKINELSERAAKSCDKRRKNSEKVEKSAWQKPDDVVR